VAASKFPGHFMSCLAAAVLTGSIAHAAGTTAQYYGGPVTENAKVYVVWWGDPAKIKPAITAAKGGIADFFAGILNSSYMDFLNQYNTTGNATAGAHMGMAGTGQRIGRGNYVRAITLANVPSGNVTDAQIQSTIDQALTAGTLPPPDDNTLYALYFPTGVTITLDGTQSCHGFGAYHNNIVETQRHAVYYMVMPDCGGSFTSVTVTTSHELIEAITDNLPTPATMPDYPQAWNDTGGNELGDLCEGANSLGGVMTPLGMFTVQNIWDERTKACTVFSSDTNDFNVAVSPNTATVASGAPTTYTVQTGVSAGTAQMLTLSATAPAGVTATVSPTTVSAGGMATLTVTVTGPSAPSLLQVVVRADATAGSAVQTHTAALLLSTSSSANNDLGTGGPDAGEGAPDLGQPSENGGAPGDDMATGGGVGVGGGGGDPTMPKGCGCVIGTAAPTSSLATTWPAAALLLLAFARLIRRRRARR
jgi:MYXO-CTERM domain-containing protein